MKLGWRKGYRVMYVTSHGRYASCTTFGKRTLYKPQGVTLRQWRCGPLSVFTSIKDARAFAQELDFIDRLFWRFGWMFSSRPTFVIVRCMYLPSIAQGLWYWENGKRIAQEDIPPGTDFADRVVTLAPAWMRAKKNDLIDIWLPWMGMCQVVFV